MGHTHPKKWDEAAAQTIRAERAVAKLSQAELADRAGLARSSYIRYEKGERIPNIAQLAAIAQGLGISMTTLVMRIDDRARNL